MVDFLLASKVCRCGLWTRIRIRRSFQIARQFVENGWRGGAESLFYQNVSFASVLYVFQIYALSVDTSVA